MQVKQLPQIQNPNSLPLNQGVGKASKWRAPASFEQVVSAGLAPKESQPIGWSPQSLNSHWQTGSGLLSLDTISAIPIGTLDFVRLPRAGNLKGFTFIPESIRVA